MENIEVKNNKGNNIALCVILLLNLLWLICDRIAFSRSLTISTVMTYVEILIAVLYIVSGYKKPHGNLLRYLLLLYAVAVAGLLLRAAAYQPTWVNATYILKIMFAVYMGGRLDHFKQNLVICVVMFICNCMVAYYLIDMITDFGITLTFVNFIGCCGAVTVWMAIAAGYVIRFKPHKEAGLADK